MVDKQIPNLGFQMMKSILDAEDLREYYGFNELNILPDLFLIVIQHCDVATMFTFSICRKSLYNLNWNSVFKEWCPWWKELTYPFALCASDDGHRGLIESKLWQIQSENKFRLLEDIWAVSAIYSSLEILKLLTNFCETFQNWLTMAQCDYYPVGLRSKYWRGTPDEFWYQISPRWNQFSDTVLELNDISYPSTLLYVMLHPYPIYMFAVFNGKLDVLKWVNDRFPLTNSYIDCVKVDFVTGGENWDPNILLLHIAAALGYEDIFRFLMGDIELRSQDRSYGEWFVNLPDMQLKQSLNQAIFFGGNFELLIWSCQHKLWLTMNDLVYIIAGGHLYNIQSMIQELPNDNYTRDSDVWRWFKLNGPRFAAEFNQFEMLKYFIHQGFLYDRCNLCEIAATSNNLEMLKWTKKFTTCQLTPIIAEMLSEYGNIEGLKWLKENNFDFDVQKCRNSAIREGKLEVLLWFDQFPWVGEIQMCDLAAKCGQLQILQYLKDKKCPWDVTTAVQLAIREGHLHILQWIYENSLFWPSSASLKFSMLKLAILSNRGQIARWVANFREIEPHKAISYFKRISISNPTLDMLKFVVEDLRGPLSYEFLIWYINHPTFGFQGSIFQYICKNWYSYEHEDQICEICHNLLSEENLLFEENFYALRWFFSNLLGISKTSTNPLFVDKTDTKVIVPWDGISKRVFITGNTIIEIGKTLHSLQSLKVSRRSKTELIEWINQKLIVLEID